MTELALGGGCEPLVRSDPIGVLELTRCCLVIALTNLTPPPAELVARRRRTLLYAVAITAYSVVLVITTRLPTYVAPLAAWATFVVAITAAMAALTARRRRDISVRRAWRGPAGAVCMIEWDPKSQRHEAYSWAAFPRHRHLGPLVAAAVMSRGRRPLWIEPALPGLREMYRSRYGFVDDPVSRWDVPGLKDRRRTSLREGPPPHTRLAPVIHGVG